MLAWQLWYKNMLMACLTFLILAYSLFMTETWTDVQNFSGDMSEVIMKKLNELVSSKNTATNPPTTT